MSIADRVLEMVGDQAGAEVSVTTTSTALTRFANSFIHQNVSDTETAVGLTVARDGRVASVSTQVTSDEGLSGLVSSAIEVAAASPVDEQFAGFAPPQDVPDVDHFDQATADASPAQRADVVKAFVDAGSGMRAAGYCDTTTIDATYANTEGHRAHGQVTQATIDGIHQTGSSAGSGHQAGLRLSELDGAAVGATAASKARAAEDAFDLKPGRYEVVLEPAAVGTMAIFLSFYGTNGLAAVEGRAFAEVGEEKFDGSFKMWDDGTDPRAISLPFDAEGTSRRPLTLIEGGAVRAFAHNRSTASRMDTESTGHGAPAAMRQFGAIAGNLFIEPGTASRDDMIGSIDRGLVVTEFNYCRVLDPRTIGMTGLTRNGTFMIENGQITGAVTNLRFTQSIVEALSPGAINGIESNARMAPCEFGSGITYVPSMHLAEWNFTGGAAG